MSYCLPEQFHREIEATIIQQLARQLGNENAQHIKIINPFERVKSFENINIQSIKDSENFEFIENTEDGSNVVESSTVYQRISNWIYYSMFNK